MLIIAEKEISKLNNNKVFQWIKSKEMIFKDKDNSKYTFIKYPYSENLDLIYGDYLSYVGIDSKLKYAGVYDKEKDVEFLKLKEDSSCPNVINVKTGDFAIFFPQDVHAPMLSCGDGIEKIKKVIVKIKAD